MVALVVLFVLFCVLGFALLALGWFFRTLVNRWSGWSWGKRVAFAGAGAAIIMSPFLALHVAERRAVLARVPTPLRVADIEYRVEESSGFGPGGAETGLVVYRLSDQSARWARERGSSLGEALNGRFQNWQPTPVAVAADHAYRWGHDDGSRPPRAVDIRDYLDQNGFGIPVTAARAHEINRAMQSPGSIYSYGSGGSFILIDPGREKVYFAYAG